MTGTPEQKGKAITALVASMKKNPPVEPFPEAAKKEVLRAPKRLLTMTIKVLEGQLEDARLASRTVDRAISEMPLPGVEMEDLHWARQYLDQAIPPLTEGLEYFQKALAAR